MAEMADMAELSGQPRGRDARTPRSLPAGFGLAIEVEAPLTRLG